MDAHSDIWHGWISKQLCRAKEARLKGYILHESIYMKFYKMQTNLS